MNAVEHDHRPCRGCGVRQVREREARLRAEAGEAALARVMALCNKVEAVVEDARLHAFDPRPLTAGVDTADVRRAIAGADPESCYCD